MNPMNKKVPILWASVLRLTACGFIFVYHFLVLSRQETYGLGSFGLYIFFFLAGWFGGYIQKSPHQWLIGRLKRVLIPYWPVIFLVLVANRIVGYKETTWLKDAMTFVGLSMFVENPVYVISWFITMIVMLDVSLYIFFLLCCSYMRFVYVVLVMVFFQLVAPMEIRSVGLFYFGFFLSRMVKDWPGIGAHLSERWPLYRIVNERLFRLQNYTYSFFLIHGAVLIMTFHVLKLRGWVALILAFGMSLIGAYVHNRLLRKFS